MEHKLMCFFLMAQLMVYCWYSLSLAKWPVAKTIPLKFQKVIPTKSNTVEPKIHWTPQINVISPIFEVNSNNKTNKSRR